MLLGDYDEYSQSKLCLALLRISFSFKVEFIACFSFKVKSIIMILV